MNHDAYNYIYVFVFLTYSNAIIAPIATCVTSFLAGFIVFSVAGFLSVKSGVHVSKAMNAGVSNEFFTGTNLFLFFIFIFNFLF